MNLFFKFLKLYVNSSIHVALAVLSFTLITYLDFNLDINIQLLSFVFFSTIVAYTFVKYIHLIIKRRFNQQLKISLVISLFSLLPILYTLYVLNVETIIWIVVLALFTLFYVLPFLPEAKNLRDISGLKVFIIALVWSGTTVILPFVSSEVELSLLSLEKSLYILSRFIIVLVLLVPFEIRDLKLDHIYLKTLPQVLGVFQSKVLAIILTVLSFIILNLIHDDMYIYVFIHGLIIFLILFSKRYNSFLYTAFLVEAVPIIWLITKYFFT